MSRRPSASENLARKTAAALVEMEDTDQRRDSAKGGEAGSPKPRGRPPGKTREVAARTTVNLDAARHDALEKMKERTGISVHALILQGIDYITKRPESNVWDK